MKNVQISKKAMGQAVQCILSHAIELYCVGGVDSITDIHENNQYRFIAK